MSVAADSTAPSLCGFTSEAVTELRRGDWRTLKTMRLKALADAPHAFVTTWAAEWGMRQTAWLGRFTDRTWVVARVDGEAVGVACLSPAARGAPRRPFVESVWVDPPHRGRGRRRQMLDHLEVHALAAGAEELWLWVLDTNEGAGRAYVKLGFSPMVDVEQDTVKLREDGTPVKERLMSKPLL